MATHSSILAWRIPGMGGAWWAAVYGVAQSQTQLIDLAAAAACFASVWFRDNVLKHDLKNQWLYIALLQKCQILISLLITMIKTVLYRKKFNRHLYISVRA